ncbi:hypothetical protein [Cupriavidus basilensis]|uniref:hypothetical protein n=1 Tax=Cupriavidus basilensis TaxID=68895 RepID=UPI0005BA13E4|nr:hypothetical protein [Cupriavidus basilensis]
MRELILLQPGPDEGLELAHDLDEDFAWVGIAPAGGVSWQNSCRMDDAVNGTVVVSLIFYRALTEKAASAPAASLLGVNSII